MRFGGTEVATIRVFLYVIYICSLTEASQSIHRRNIVGSYSWGVTWVACGDVEPTASDRISSLLMIDFSTFTLAQDSFRCLSVSIDLYPSSSTIMATKMSNGKTTLDVKGENPRIVPMRVIVCGLMRTGTLSEPLPPLSPSSQKKRVRN